MLLLLLACTDSTLSKFQSEPTAAIVYPTDGATLPAEAPLTLRGAAADADSAPTALSARWTLNGAEVCAEAPAEDGLTTCTLHLNEGSQAIGLEVRDPGGALASTAIDVVAEAELPLLAQIDAPAADTRIDLGAPLALQGTIAGEAPLTLRWESDVDGLLGEEEGRSGGSTSALAEALSGGAHTLSLTVTDASGASQSDAVRIAVNRPPDRPTVTLSPSAPTGLDGLLATPNAADPDGDALTFSYLWTVDGSPTVYTGAEIPAGSLAKGQLWAVAVSAFDGRLWSEAGAAEVRVINTAPTVDGLTLRPDPAVAGDSLAASATGADLDGDAVTLTYRWSVNGSSAATGPSLSTALVHGDLIEVSVTPDDGTTLGAPLSASLTVGNTAPTLSATLLPTSPSAGDALTCVLGASDVDGEALTATLSWTVDGLAWTGSTATTTWTGDTIPAGEAQGGEVWTCTATVSDGLASASAAASVTLAWPLPNWAALQTFDSLAIKIRGENVDDEAGLSGAFVTDIDGDGAEEVLAPAPFADPSGSYSGQVGLFYSSGLTANTTISAADVLLTGESLANYAGITTADLGDLDGDGMGDFAIGAYGGAGWKGRVYTVFGGDLSAGTASLSTARHHIDGPTAGYFGSGLAAVGDLDGDGLTELLVGASALSSGSYTNHGAVYLFTGAQLAAGSATSASSAGWSILGTTTKHFIGRALDSVGDLDGDGLPDLGLGDEWPAGYTDCRVYLFLSGSLGASGAFTTSDADWDVIGASDQSWCGASVSGGDFDGDGYSDLLTTDLSSNSSKGRAYIVSATDLAAGVTLDDAVTTIDGAAAITHAKAMPDYDGDDKDELMVVDMSYLGKGALLVTTGASLGGSLGLGDLDHGFLSTVTEYPNPHNHIGFSGLDSGDFDGDGAPDLLIGVPYNDDLGQNAGALYLIPGN